MKNINIYDVSELSSAELFVIAGGCSDDWSWAKRLGCGAAKFFNAVWNWAKEPHPSYGF